MDTTPRKTAEEYEAESRQALQAREESFERSDTDGFLSQWAHGLTSALAQTKAAIVRAGGRSEFWGLYTQDGRRVAARVVESQYGCSWLLREDEAEKVGRKFIPCGETSRIQKKLGLCEKREMAPAWAKYEGRGFGLSGSCWVATFRTGDKWGQDATPVVAG